MSLGGGEMGGIGQMFGGGEGGFKPMGLMHMLTGTGAYGSPEEPAAPELETKQLPGYSGGAGAIPLYGKQAQQSRGQAPAAGPQNAFDMGDVPNMPAEWNEESAMKFFMDNPQLFKK